MKKSRYTDSQIMDTLKCGLKQELLRQTFAESLASAAFRIIRG